MTLIHLLAVVLGISISLQGAVNGRLAGRIGLPLTLAITSGVVFLSAIAWHLLTPTVQRSSNEAASPPWFLYTGGIFGLLILASAAIAFPRLGAGTTTVIAVATQLVAALVIDRYATAGPQVSWTMPRLLGFALVATGTWLVVTAQPRSSS